NMLVQTIFSALAAATIATAANQNHTASIANDNPAGAAYMARLPDRPDTTIRGNITAVTDPDGNGVLFAVDLEGLPMEGGPFPYHIHDHPVPSDGNCTGTLAHLDPWQRGETPPCDANAPATCQVGDLAGKHGKAKAPTFADSYTDLYTSLQQGKGAFFGNRSITIHFANTTRITCANFTLIAS
ncbi:Cu,Zn superoxide dismutase-like protein, partial [Rhizodiscina lignyota]